MSAIIIVALLKANEGDEEALEKAIHIGVEAAHEEEGCLLAAAHRVVDEPSRYMIVEKWRSQEDLDRHMANPFFSETMTQYVTLLAEAPGGTVALPFPVGQEAKGTL